MIFKAIIGFKKYLLNQKKPRKTHAQNFGIERVLGFAYKHLAYKNPFKFI